MAETYAVTQPNGAENATDLLAATFTTPENSGKEHHPDYEIIPPPPLTPPLTTIPTPTAMPSPPSPPLQPCKP